MCVLIMFCLPMTIGRTTENEPHSDRIGSVSATPARVVPPLPLMKIPHQTLGAFPTTLQQYRKPALSSTLQPMFQHSTNNSKLNSVKLPTETWVSPSSRSNKTEFSKNFQISSMVSSSSLNPVSSEHSNLGSISQLIGTMSQISESAEIHNFPSTSISKFPDGAESRSGEGAKELQGLYNTDRGNSEDSNHSIKGLYNTQKVSFGDDENKQSTPPIAANTPRVRNLQKFFYRHSVAESRHDKNMNEERDNFDPGKSIQSDCRPELYFYIMCDHDPTYLSYSYAAEKSTHNLNTW